MATQASPLKLPGFGKPINARTELKFSYNNTEKFPIAVIDEGYDYGLHTCNTGIDVTKVCLQSSSTSDTRRKIYDDDAIVAKWRVEALATKLPKNNCEAVAKYEPAEEPTNTDSIEHIASETVNSRDDDLERCVDYRAAEVSPRMFDWAIAEVKYKAQLFKQINYVEALDGVWKSDTIIDEKLRKALERAVHPLEDVSELRSAFHHYDQRVP
ncbi:MAG: hypothetical protein Q9218_003945 [Villophora microphyllina]